MRVKDVENLFNNEFKYNYFISLFEQRKYLGIMSYLRIICK